MPAPYPHRPRIIMHNGDGYFAAVICPWCSRIAVLPHAQAWNYPSWRDDRLTLTLQYQCNLCFTEWEEITDKPIQKHLGRRPTRGERFCYWCELPRSMCGCHISQMGAPPAYFRYHVVRT